MRKPNIQLCYQNDSKEFEFKLDTGNSNDRRRIISTIEWAARNGVELQIVPIREEQKAKNSVAA